MQMETGLRVLAVDGRSNGAHSNAQPQQTGAQRITHSQCLSLETLGAWLNRCVEPAYSFSGIGGKAQGKGVDSVLFRGLSFRFKRARGDDEGDGDDVFGAAPVFIRFRSRSEGHVARSYMSASGIDERPFFVPRHDGPRGDFLCHRRSVSRVFVEKTCGALLFEDQFDFRISTGV